MAYRKRLAAFSLCLAAGLAAAGTEQTDDQTAPAKIMLQGSSAAELRALVEANGGTVTHDLPIINAVGTLLSPGQLREVLKSPLVSRHIDDLSVSAPPIEGLPAPDQSCDVGGALELRFAKDGFSWNLYNKRDLPARLESLELTWPAMLGSVSGMSLNKKALDTDSLHGQMDGSLTLAVEPSKAPELLGSGDLQVSFNAEHALADDLPLRQRDFTIKARFTGDCAVELIPGYDDNHENFHYTQVVGVDALHQHGVTGRGITIAVLDSGLWEDRALALDTSGKNRILARYNAISDTAGKQVFDESGHGTHMSSVIAHSGPVTRDGNPTGAFKGVAPDANLVAVKAFDVAGQGDFLDIVRAVQWVVDNRETYNIRVLNLSFAARPRWPYWLDPINQAIMRAWASGITVVAAAGNEGPDNMTIGSPGNIPYIITVGAVTDSWTPDDRDDDYIPDFSSRGPTPSGHIKPDIVAPGGHITGLTRPGSTLTLEHPEYLLATGEFVMTGSSQASALVAGIVAILLQLEPRLTPDDIKCKLITSAEPAINQDGLLAYSPFEQGHGLVNVSRAITLGQRGCGNTGMDILADTQGKEHFEGPAIVAKNGQASLPGLESMVSAEPAAKGPSKTRKWGVKDHIERLDMSPPAPSAEHTPPFDWHHVYLQEKTAVENLARQKPR